MLRASYIPNIICVLRIFLVVPILISLHAGEFTTALILIFIAGFSDVLDGFLAKQFDWRTRLGGILDPLADKFLLVTVMLMLTLLELVPLWLTFIVIGRDVVIIGGAVAYNLLIGQVKPEPTIISKINTLLQLFYIVVVIAQQAFGWPPAILIILAGTGVFCTSVVSGMDYVMSWSRKAISATRG